MRNMKANAMLITQCLDFGEQNMDHSIHYKQCINCASCWNIWMWFCRNFNILPEGNRKHETIFIVSNTSTGHTFSLNKIFDVLQILGNWDIYKHLVKYGDVSEFCRKPSLYMVKCFKIPIFLHWQSHRYVTNLLQDYHYKVPDS